MRSDSIPGLERSNWVQRWLPCVFVLSGGLGNQLFSYAAGVYFSRLNHRKVIFELSDTDLLKAFHTSSILKFNPNWLVIRLRFRKVIFRVFRLIQSIVSLTSNTKVIYGSPVLGYDIHMEKHKDAMLVRGHFQTYKYLLDKVVSSELMKLSVTDTTDAFYRENAELSGRKVLGVHVRLGNYSELQESFGSLNPNYFRSAIREALNDENCKINYIYLYSEDPEKANQDLDLKNWGVPVKLIGRDSGMTDEETFSLMSKSDSLVISNSTFSWWAAALGTQEKRVYAPSKWFKGMNDPVDLYPPHWKLIQSQWR
jgi:hypothetical protein